MSSYPRVQTRVASGGHFLLAALLVSTALVAPAFAQVNPPPVSVAETLPDVVVVAQRRPQNSQKVGLSITTVSARQLANNGVRKINDIEYYVPNLQIRDQFGTGQPSFTIRGVGSDFNDYGSNNESPIGFYIDEVAYPIASTTQGQLYDIHDVEVLRGPQGTLYGRNSTGGAININLNKPTHSLAYGGSIEYGSYNNAILEGYVSGPITDNLRIRLTGDTNQGGGWQYNRTTGQTLGNNNTKALRSIVDWDATPDLSFELNVHWARDQSDSTGASLLGARALPGGGSVPADTSVRATGWGASTAFASEIGITPDQKPFRNNQGFGADLRTVYTLPFARLTSLTSAERFDRKEYNSLDGSGIGAADVYFSTRAGAYAEDLRLSSLTDDPISWQAGVYYSREHLADTYGSGFSDLVSLDPELGVDAHVAYGQDVETKSAYGHVEGDITSQLKLILGARLENEQRKIDNFSSDAFIEPGGIQVLGNGESPANQSTKFTLPSWKAELDEQLTPNTLLYTFVAAGVKSGGFTTYNTGNTAAALRPFKPERLLDFEVGTKNEFLDHRLLVNAGAFYYQYRDQQILGVTLSPQGNAIGTFVNAPKLHLYGGEAELDWIPIDGLNIDQSAGLTAGAFDEFEDGIGSSGTTPPFLLVKNLKGRGIGAPRLTYNVNASYDIPVSYRFTAEIGGDFSYIDQYISLLNSSATTHSFNLPAYGLLNLYATLIPNFHNWQAQVFARNVLNRKYLVSNNYFDSIADPIGVYGIPATYGVRLSYNFQ